VCARSLCVYTCGTCNPLPSQLQRGEKESVEALATQAAVARAGNTGDAGEAGGCSGVTAAQRVCAARRTRATGGQASCPGGGEGRSKRVSIVSSRP